MRFPRVYDIFIDDKGVYRNFIEFQGIFTENRSGYLGIYPLVATGRSFLPFVFSQVKTSFGWNFSSIIPPAYILPTPLVWGNEARTPIIFVRGFDIAYTVFNTLKYLLRVGHFFSLIVCLFQECRWSRSAILNFWILQILHHLNLKHPFIWSNSWSVWNLKSRTINSRRKSSYKNLIRYLNISFLQLLLSAMIYIYSMREIYCSGESETRIYIYNFMRMRTNLSWTSSLIFFTCIVCFIFTLAKFNVTWSSPS